MFLNSAHSSIKLIKGFSLLEQIILLVILSVLYGLLIPSFQDYIFRHFQQLTLNQFVNTLNTARLQALIKQKTVTVCPIKHYSSSACCRKKWTNIWLIYEGKYTPCPNIPTHIIRLHKGFRSSTINQYHKIPAVEYKKDGSTPGFNSTFIIQTGNISQRVIVNRLGRVRVDYT